MALYGYTGKILDVDLSTVKTTKRALDARFAREFIGGMGFSCKILYDEVGPSVDPFSPDNVIIFANGPLTGTKVPCSGRTEITTKSPLTGSIATGNTGGLWGTRLKHAGFDLMIVRGRAEMPVYLWINNDIAEIREANHLWGKETHLPSNMLTQELGPSPPSGISVLAIGPAGENLVRYACPLNDYHHAAARGGTGAVMGAKRLKAIAVQGTRTLKAGKPREFQKAIREARDRLLTADRARKMPGSPLDPRSFYVERGGLKGRNFQTGVISQFLETRSRDAALRYVKKKRAPVMLVPYHALS